MKPPPKTPRGLTAQEAALWAQVAATVTPIKAKRIDSHRPVVVQPVTPPPTGEGDHAKQGGGAGAKAPARSGRDKMQGPLRRPVGGPPPRSGEDRTGLDSHWERRLSRGATEPDFTLDLHGHTLDQAHRRLDAGLMQAKAMGARLVLVITGKHRPVDAADRGERRGAIRAKILDWLAAGPHAADIAAVRNAQRRHGGEGALYLVLRRKKG